MGYGTPTWQRALEILPLPVAGRWAAGRWAVGGSASLALRGVPVRPDDLDVSADDVAVDALAGALADSVVTDDAPWDRGDVRRPGGCSSS